MQIMENIMTNEDREKAQISAPDYIRANFHPSDHLAVLVRNRKWGATIQRIATAEKIAAPRFQDWLRYKNEKDGCDVYVGMNALKPRAHSRTKDDILTIRHVYVDLDHEASKSLAAIGQSDLVPEPSYVLQTSPDKFQVIWRVDEIAQDRAEELQHAMVHEFGGDPAATDSTRVLRLPGFANKKYDHDFTVAVHSHTGVIHHSQDFRLCTEPGEAALTRSNRPQGRSPSSCPHQLSQSERDWAYAKRALARGLDPDEIMRNIAEFRTNDKYDPRDYARRTVAKAQAELQHTALNQSMNETGSHERLQ
jgi:hypothetical protein